MSAKVISPGGRLPIPTNVSLTGVASRKRTDRPAPDRRRRQRERRGLTGTGVISRSGSTLFCTSFASAALVPIARP